MSPLAKYASWPTKPVLKSSTPGWPASPTTPTYKPPFGPGQFIPDAATPPPEPTPAPAPASPPIEAKEKSAPEAPAPEKLTAKRYPLTRKDAAAKTRRSNSWVKGPILTHWSADLFNRIPAWLYTNVNELKKCIDLYTILLSCRPALSSTALHEAVCTLEREWYGWLRTAQQIPNCHSLLQWMATDTRHYELFKIDSVEVAEYVLAHIGPLVCTSGLIITGMSLSAERAYTTYMPVHSNTDPHIEPCDVPFAAAPLLEKCLDGFELYYVKKLK